MHKLFSKESIAALIAGTRRSIKQYAWEKLRPCGVTPQQSGVMMALYSEGGMSLGEVASRIYCDNPTACRIVNKLVERGLVRSDSDAQDRRRFRLFLTEEGRALCEDVSRRTDGFSEILEQGLSEEDLGELRRILRQVMSNAVAATARPDKTIAAATASSLGEDPSDAPSRAIAQSAPCVVNEASGSATDATAADGIASVGPHTRGNLAEASSMRAAISTDPAAPNKRL